jgi:pimeloyl-ACP methyl ester carboxylesterase
VILAGVEGPDHTLKLPTNIQQHLEKLQHLAKADAGVSSKVPDLMALMKAVMDKLEKQPITVEVTDPQTKQKVKVTLGRFDLQRMTAAVLGNEPMVGIPALYYALSQGETSNFLVTLVAQQALGERRGTLGSAMPYMMDCSSNSSPERRRRIEREAKGTLLGDAIDFPFLEVCPGWGSPDLGPAFRAPVKSKVPVLFISGTLDARTPVSNAEEVRQGLPNSAHLIIDGAVHSDPLFLSSPQIKETMLEFMKGRPVSATRIALPPLRLTPVK